MQVYVLQSQCMQHVASILDRNKYIVYIHEFIHLYNHLNLNQTGSLFDGILLLEFSKSSGDKLRNLVPPGITEKWDPGRF